MTSPGRTLLACWVAVVLTGTAVDHWHGTTPGHTHGYGWAALPADHFPGGLPVAHRHFVLLGVELGAVPGDADAGGPPSDRTSPAAGIVAPADHDGRAAGDLLPDWLLVPAPLGAVSPGADRGSATPRPPGHDRPHLCALASHARTGVLRT